MGTYYDEPVKSQQQYGKQEHEQLIIMVVDTIEEPIRAEVYSIIQILKNNKSFE